MTKQPFVEGQEYDRRSEIHEVYGGSRFGGIAACAQHPYVFLFSSRSGEEYGYKNGWDDDGCFVYTGEGQFGEMTMSRGNKAIRDHAGDGRALHVFRRYRTYGKYEYLGEFKYLSHHEVPGRDAADKPRTVIQFRLKQVV